MTNQSKTIETSRFKFNDKLRKERDILSWEKTCCVIALCNIMRQYGESISKSKRCWNDVSQQGISKHSQTRRQFFYLQEIKQNQIRGRRNRASRWFYCTWERVWKEGDARRLKKKPIEVFNYREEPSLAVSEPGRGQRFSSAITLRSTAARIFPGINASGYPARGKEATVIHGRLKVSFRRV